MVLLCHLDIRSWKHVTGLRLQSGLYGIQLIEDCKFLGLGLLVERLQEIERCTLVNRTLHN